MDTQTIRKLDLGGTACYASPEAVSISLDGTAGDDEYERIGERYEEGEPIDVYKVTNPTHKIIGDFNHMPFPSNYFDEAFGSCYLEGDELTGEAINDLDELHRVMKPRSMVYLTGCQEYDVEGQNTGNNIQDLLNLVVIYAINATRVGFHVEVEDGDGDSENAIIGCPIIRLYKK